MLARRAQSGNTTRSAAGSLQVALSVTPGDMLPQLAPASALSAPLGATKHLLASRSATFAPSCTHLQLGRKARVHVYRPAARASMQLQAAVSHASLGISKTGTSMRSNRARHAQPLRPTTAVRHCAIRCALLVSTCQAATAVQLAPQAKLSPQQAPPPRHALTAWQEDMVAQLVWQHALHVRLVT